MKDWMDCSEDIEVGEIVFCAQVLNTNNAVGSMEVSRTAYRKNMSGQQILRGWCGTTNNIDIQAVGAAIVVQCSERLDDYGCPVPRCKVEHLSDTDPRVVEICDELGVTIKRTPM